MANYNASDYQTLVNGIQSSNNSAGVNDNIIVLNNITLTPAQILSLTTPDGSGNLRFRSLQTTGGNESYTVVVQNDLSINDNSPATAQPSFTIGPITLQIGNGGTAGGLSGNLRLDDGGILTFNRSVNTLYTGTLSVEDEDNALRNNVAGTTVTLSGANGTNGLAVRASQGTGAASAYELEIGGVGNGVISGVIADGGLATAAGSLVMDGTGTWTLSATNTYLGPTRIEGGTLRVDGSIVSNVTIEDGGMLGGSGRVGAVTSLGGTLSASAAGFGAGSGVSIGTLRTGNLQLDGESTLVEDVGGNIGNITADRIQVTGTVNLGGATLSLTGGANKLPTRSGDRIVLIDNDGTDAVVGTFDDLAEGEELTVGAQTYRITYHGDAGGAAQGNDVILTDITGLGGGDDDGPGGGGDDDDGPGGGRDDDGPVGRVVNGTDGPDSLVGGDGDDTLMGLAGNDTLLGGDGEDLLFGNQGDDLLLGNQEEDTLFGGQGQDTLYGGQDRDVLLGNLGDDVLLGNIGNDTLYGGQGNDSLYGGQGDDVLFGDLGNDVLFGDLGNDVLQGGAGADRYVFNVNSGSDVILGFNATEGDRIDLRGQTYTFGTAADGSGSALLVLSGGGTIELAGVTRGQVNNGFFA